MYVFEGKTIKLNFDDYQEALELYSNLDLRSELEQIDVQLRGTKKWWPEMHAKLNYRNKQKNDTRNRSLKNDLFDRGWAK